MSKTGKWILLIALSAAIFTGAFFLYKNLSKDYGPGNLEVNPQHTDKTEVEKESATENQNLAKAPDFTVVNREGKEVQLSELRGKPVVINFWRLSCTYCKMEMPDFQKAFEEYGEDIHFVMVHSTVDEQETKENVIKYLEEKGLTFPVYFDTKNEAVTNYKVYGFPNTFFIDKDGQLIANAKGMIDLSTLKTGIEMILRGK